MIKPKKSRIDPASLRMAALALFGYAPLLVGLFGGVGWALAKALAGRWLAALGILVLCPTAGAALSFAFVGLSHKLEGLVER